MGENLHETESPAVWSPKQYGKVWRWHVIGGLCLMQGYRYGAELGVSHGRFTSFLCSIMPDMRMIAVDLWAPQETRCIDGAEDYKHWNHDSAHDGFQAHCAKHFPGRVEIKRMRTDEAYKDVPDGSLDFVFIDADHTYEGALSDIRLWTPKVRKDGIVSGHDLNWPTVLKAVKETGSAFIGNDNVWYRFIK